MCVCSFVFLQTDSMWRGAKIKVYFEARATRVTACVSSSVLFLQRHSTRRLRPRSRCDRRSNRPNTRQQNMTRRRTHTPFDATYGSERTNRLQLRRGAGQRRSSTCTIELQTGFRPPCVQTDSGSFWTLSCCLFFFRLFFFDF